MAEELLLCTGCAKDYQGASGLCDECHKAHLADRYAERDHQAVTERRAKWKGWSESPEFLSLRQKRHRLLTQTKPQELAHPGSDPLLLAAECLEHLRRIKPAIGAQSRALAHLDAAEELVKQLGWGPQSLPKAERKTTPSSVRGRGVRTI